MARIALGITLVLLLATCYFGFETRSKVTGLNDKITGLGTELTSTQNTLAKAKADLSTTKDSLAKETADDEQTKSQLSTVQSSLDAATAQVTTLKGQVDDLTKQVQLAKNGPAPVVQPGGPSQADYDNLKKQFADAQAQVAELTQLKETLTNKAKDAESRADDLEKVVDHYKSGTVRNGLEGEVLAVNQGWNFVVLSIGDRQGAVANAEMIIKRDGAQIGKVRITSVEPSTSVADIIPGSLARGVRVEPGDRVIFPGG
jgi:predicted  nucleic acid-binding Zn-ribbon protein